MGTAPPPSPNSVTPVRKTKRTWLGHLICGLILVYQRGVSPFLGHRCRFTPSCSHYALDAIDTWGVGKGLVLIIKRLGACHPWGRSGYDPVPTPASHSKVKDHGLTRNA